MLINNRCGFDRLPEQFAANLGNGLRSVLFYLCARHGRRSADAKKWPFSAQAILDPPHQHRHVGPLSAAVRMQFVEDEKLKSNRILNYCSIELILPRHKQFEHHEVGQEYIGLNRGNRFTFGFGLLTRVTLVDGL